MALARKLRAIERADHLTASAKPQPRTMRAALCRKIRQCLFAFRNINCLEALSIDSRKEVLSLDKYVSTSYDEGVGCRSEEPACRQIAQS